MLLVDRARSADLAAPVDRRRGAPGRGVGLRSPPGRGGAATARRRHRRAHHPARGGLDRRRRPSRQGLLSRPGNRRPSAQPGQTAANAGAAAPGRVGGPAQPPAIRCWPAAAQWAGWEPSSTTSIWDRSRLALLKRAIPADTALSTGGDADVAAMIDAESLPAADGPGAGRVAVERLRGTAR